MEKENFGKCCQSTKGYSRMISASGIPWIVNQQYICHLNEDMRALEFCLNFYKDPKTVALIAKKPALGLSSDWLVTWATNSLGQAQCLVGTALAPHRSAFLQNGIKAILLFCF